MAVTAAQRRYEFMTAAPERPLWCAFKQRPINMLLFRGSCAVGALAVRGKAGRRSFVERNIAFLTSFSLVKSTLTFCLSFFW